MLCLGDSYKVFWIAVLILVSLIEFFRLKGKISFLNRYFAKLLRPGEDKRISGSFYYLWGVGLAFLLFPQEPALIGLWVLAVGDALAGLAPKGHSLVFFLCAIFILKIFGYPLDPQNLLKVFLWTAVEKLPRVDDNLTLPLVVALTL